MFFAGIADEAGEPIDLQIKAIQALGWRHVELRKVSVDGHPAGMIHDIPETDFERVAGQIESAGLTVSCISSAIANWGKSVLAPFDSSLAEAERCLTRMKRLHCERVRIMSFQVIKDAAGKALPPDQQHREERFRRLRQLQALFAAEGITVVHENCMNYGGMGWTMTQELVEAVPGLKLVFDTGNPVFAEDFTKPEPRPRQDALEFFRRVRDHVCYVHIKDGVWNPARQACDFCYPGEGEGQVRAILADLHASGYQGGVSIEPHLGAVFHEANRAQADAERRFAIFVEYGKRLQSIARAAGLSANGTTTIP